MRGDVPEIIGRRDRAALAVRVGDHQSVTGAVRSDADGRGSALLAGELTRPRGIGGLLRGGEKLLEIAVPFASAEVSARALDLSAHALS